MEELPDIPLLEILKYLPAEEVARFASLGRRCRDAARADVLWAPLCALHFGCNRRCEVSQDHPGAATQAKTDF